jgi:Cdc6-like AAA superfamily ATPase
MSEPIVEPSPDWNALAFEVGRVFTPNAPIDELSLFAGRHTQIRKIVDAVNQKGLHAMMFGERGVGKTSLTNVLKSLLSQPGGSVMALRVNCDATDSFETVWRKILKQIQLTKRLPVAGFEASQSHKRYPSTDLLKDAIAPDDVRNLLELLSENTVLILIVDEFDRLGKEPRRAFADTIKSLSDHAVRATVVLVGVADSVEQLIEEHQSVERALVQIRMPRMSNAEIEQIIDTCLKVLHMGISEPALKRISILSQGLPHYAHLIGLHAARAAIDSQSLTISENAVDEAIVHALGDAQQSILSAWHNAITSPRKDNLFADVLLACALAPTNELGFFAAQDVRPPIRVITKKDYDIPSFAQHLNEFSDEKRGPILLKTGETRRYRYRFINPLMQPFVIMQGFKSGKLTREMIDKLEAGQNQ